MIAYSSMIRRNLQVNYDAALHPRQYYWVARTCTQGYRWTQGINQRLLLCTQSPTYSILNKDIISSVYKRWYCSHLFVSARTNQIRVNERWYTVVVPFRCIEYPLHRHTRTRASIRRWRSSHASIASNRIGPRSNRHLLAPRRSYTGYVLQH